MKFYFLLIFTWWTATTAVATNDPLPAAEVFQVKVEKVDPNTMAIRWLIKPDYFLYSDRIKITTTPNSNLHLGTLRLPPATIKVDKQGHRYTVYRNNLSIPIGILGEQAGESLINLHYQGCSDSGFCYPPETKTIKLTVNNDLALTHASLEDTPPIAATTKSQEQNEITSVFSEHHWAVTLLIFFGFGLLLSFTPCILPMIPVLSGIIVGHGKEVTTRKAFLLSLSYVLSMSITYACIGALVALLGANLQISMQSPWAVGLFSLIFVALALSMFGFYEFRLPSAWQNKIAGSSTSPRGGHYLGAAIMGCLSTLILSPCVTAPLIGALTYIAQSHNLFLGSLTLLVLGLGMGTPLLLIGTSAGKWLPKTGSWMNAIKAFFGVLLLGVALYLLERILPLNVVQGGWACLLIGSGIYSGALVSAITNRDKLCQSIGIILLAYGLLMLVGVSMGSTNLFQPLTLLNATHSDSKSTLTIPTIESLGALKQALKENQGLPIVLDFYADWCVSCKVIAATTLQDPVIQKALTSFKIFKIDITANNQEDKQLMKRFHVIAPPAFIFLNAQGQELHHLTLVGEISPSKLLATLQQVQ